MTSQIAIEQGRPPWLPAADAEPVLTLHTYDMPLVGVIRQHGQLYLFRCIDGHVDKANLWTYTVLSPEEFAELEQVTTDSLDDTVDSAAADRPAVLALADDNRGITLSTLIDHPEDFPTLLHAASASLGEAAAQVNGRLGRSVA
jgi:hypothetical protein